MNQLVSAPSGLFEQYQGWILTGLSSLMCVFGSSIIYFDLIIHFFNKRSTFDIKSNEDFLICGFSTSAGSLLFTSLYKLLPKALEYFKSIKSETLLNPNSEILCYFFGGVLVCVLLSELIHRFTRESIVHCNHGGDDHDHDENDTNHSHSHGKMHNDLEDHSHSHSHSSSSDSLEQEDDKHHAHKHSHTPSHSSHNHILDEENLIENHIPSSSTTSLPDENTLLLNEGRQFSKKKSILQFFDKLKHQHECVGIEDENCEGDAHCVSEDLTKRVTYDIHNLEFYRGPTDSLVAYTNSTDNLPIAVDNHTQTLDSHQGNYILTNEPNLKLHTLHKDDHHHKINTPISKLLSIGLQTCLALTLHKFPEGFITYATSQADPELGISIFLSLAIHNIIEGFSMTLPLYLALNSRIKAFSIVFILGGFSQPIGAVLGYLVLNGKHVDKDNSSFVFGILISITSGFLTVISLQLFASAINFGGSTNKVMGWCLAGVFVIMLSSSLTGN